jgi:hypothetical protein
MPPSTFSQMNERIDNLVKTIVTVDENLSKEIARVAEELRSVRRSFYTFAFGVVGSSIVFAFTVFALLGK